MKFVHCSDFHFGIYKYGKLNSETGLNTRFEQDLNIFDNIIKYTITNKIGYFFMTGDTFDKRKPDAIVRREVIKRLKFLADNNVKVIMLMSNHDNVNTKDEAHCLSSEQLLIEKNIYIISKQTTIRVKDADSLYIICLPYYNKFEIKNSMKNVILLGHFTVSGARQGNYVFNNNYVDPEEFSHPNIRYAGFGHLHQNQLIKNIMYVGSPYQINFNDVGIKKGFIHGMVNSNKYAFVELLGQREFVEISEKYRSGLKKEWDKLDFNRRILKINLEITSENQYMYINRIKNYLIKRGAIVDSINIKRNIAKSVRDTRYHVTNTPESLLKLYLKDKDDNVITKGIEILKEVKDD